MTSESQKVSFPNAGIQASAQAEAWDSFQPASALSHQILGYEKNSPPGNRTHMLIDSLPGC